MVPLVEFVWSTLRHLQLLYSGGDELWNCFTHGMVLLSPGGFCTATTFPQPPDAGEHLEAQVL